MNTKKATWVHRPSSPFTTDLHSFSWAEDNESSVFWTIGEEGEISLSYEKDEDVSVFFVFLHTPSDYISFHPSIVVSSFFSLSSSFPASIESNMKMVKEGDTISFFSGESLIEKIQNPAFEGSASFGFYIKGKGKVRTTVF
ncbi:MAG: hypothetical protein ACI4S4_07195 [Candidatus Ornithospirochaeta sp.]